MRLQPGRCLGSEVKTAAGDRNPPSQTIRIRLQRRHPKSIVSAHAAAGVLETFPSKQHDLPNARSRLRSADNSARIDEALGLADSESTCPTWVRRAGPAFVRFEFFDALFHRRYSSGSAGMVSSRFASDHGDPKEHTFAASGAGQRVPDRFVWRSLHLLPFKVVRVLPMVRYFTGARQYICREIVTSHSTSTASAASQMLGKKARTGNAPVRAFFVFCHPVLLRTGPQPHPAGGAFLFGIR